MSRWSKALPHLEVFEDHLGNHESLLMPPTTTTADGSRAAFPFPPPIGPHDGWDTVMSRYLRDPAITPVESNEGEQDEDREEQKIDEQEGIEERREGHP